MFVKVENKDPFPAKLDALTSMRFYAAIFVVFFHLRERLPFDIDSVTHLLASGYLAVDFFFILSGFILTHVYQQSVLEGRLKTGDFWIKRFARIYPMHLFGLAFYVTLYFASKAAGLSLNQPEKYDLSAIPANLLMIHAWGTTSGLTFNYPSWSISAEWFAYLLFPFVVPTFYRWSIRSNCLASLLVLGACWIVATKVWDLPPTSLTYEVSILRILPEFLIGITIYRIGQVWELRRDLVLPAFWLTLLTIAVFLHFELPTVFDLVLFSALIVLGAELSRSGSKVLHGQGHIYLGEISYSVYMVHAIVLTLVFNAAKVLIPSSGSPTWSLVLSLSVVPLVLLMAAATYRWVEVPSRRWINGTYRRLSKGRQEHT